MAIVIISALGLVISLLFISDAITSWGSAGAILDLIMVGCLFLNTAFRIKALGQLSIEGQNQFWRIIFWSKEFAGKDNFTTDGWRYWVRVRYLTILFIFLFIARQSVK